MKLSRLGEFGLIERVRRATPRGHDVLLGIGDDAAWVRTRSSSGLLTADLLIEGVHFDLKWTSLYALGYKALAVNLSDIAAMGGLPAYIVLSLGIPANFDSEDVKEFYRGIRSLALKNRVALVGGDTSVAKSFCISACLFGHAPYRPITRGGAEVGDDIYVTGTLGDSALGLNLLKRKSPKLTDPAAKFLLSRHLFPAPRLRAGLTLAKEKLARAMIDISDGLLQDLGHICKASRIGAVILEEKLPLSSAYRTLARPHEISYALAGGEDYELLFCARPRDRTRLESLRGRFDVPITRIGRCIPARDGMKVLNPKGQRTTFRARGHDHFKKG